MLPGPRCCCFPVSLRGESLTIVQPDTFIHWHWKGFRLFGRRKSKPRGRPRVPGELQKLIVEMATENPTWGEERIAAELLLKVGIRISPRTVRSYMPKDRGPRHGPSSQRWRTFVRNHAEGILACDFFVTVTVSFGVLCVFVVLEVGGRRIAHINVTAHPTADWTLQQFREVITGEKPYRFLVHDRDRICSSAFDSAVEAMGLSILKTPFRATQANAFCERLIGGIRRECLDFLWHRQGPESSLATPVPANFCGVCLHIHLNCSLREGKRNGDLE
jgi:putative transposase